MNEILPGLFLGDSTSGEDKDNLKSLGITHILIAASEIQPQFPTEFSYLCRPLDDTTGQDVMSHFQTTNEFISQALISGGKVLVHCRAGVSRSATIVLAYLMNTLQMDLQEALAFAQKKRSVIGPNYWFLTQLRVYENELVSFT